MLIVVVSLIYSAICVEEENGVMKMSPAKLAIGGEAGVGAEIVGGEQDGIFYFLFFTLLQPKINLF